MGPDSEIAEDKLARLHEVLGWVNDYVKEGGFLVGSTFSLADIIYVASYSTLVATEAVDLAQVRSQCCIEELHHFLIIIF